MSTLSKFAGKKFARTHEDARAVVCCVCARKLKDKKGGMPVINTRIEILVRQFVHKDYSVHNIAHPTAICGSCRVALCSREKDPSSTRHKLPKLLDYDKVAPPPLKTRGKEDDSCECFVCSIARMNLDYSAFVAKNATRSGPPPTSVKSPPAKTLNLCSKCWAHIGRGKTHQCQKSTKRENLVDIVRNTSDKSRSKVTAAALKTIAIDSGVSLKGGVVELGTGSKPIPVQIGTPKLKPKNCQFSIENLKKLQAANNMSDKTLLKIAGAIRVGGGRKSVEPGLERALTERNHMLDHLFEAETIIVKEKKKKDDDESTSDSETEAEVDLEDGYKLTERVGVFCVDCSQLVLEVMAHRGLNPHNCDVHVGFDGGQGMLKLALTVTDRLEVECGGRSRYADGVAAKQGKNSGVKKLLLVAAIPGAPENYATVKATLDRVDIDALEFTVAADVKMLRIIVGKSSGSPKYGCPYCSASSPYKADGNLYTLGNLSDLHERYVADGSISKKQQLYENVTNQPLITGAADDLVLKLLAVPELHLLLGLVDKLISGVENTVFDTKKHGRKFMDNFLKKVYIVRKSYQGGHSLEGNQCLMFLKKVDTLQQELEKQSVDALLNGLPFIHTLRALSRVVESCFGMELGATYISDIKEFKRLYLALGVTVTPKAHILFQHIAEFIQMVNSDPSFPPVGLGYFCEQSFESMHHDVKVLWDRMKVAVGHPDFPEKLKAFVSAYNAKHF